MVEVAQIVEVVVVHKLVDEIPYQTELVVPCLEHSLVEKSLMEEELEVLVVVVVAAAAVVVVVAIVAVVPEILVLWPVVAKKTSTLSLLSSIEV